MHGYTWATTIRLLLGRHTRLTSKDYNPHSAACIGDHYRRDTTNARLGKGFSFHIDVSMNALPLQIMVANLSGSTEDSLSGVYRAYIEWCNALSPATVSFLARAFVILFVPSLICSLTFFHLRLRSVAIQWAALLVGLFVAFEIPLPVVDVQSLPRAWIITLSLFVLVVMPGLLGWLVTRTVGGRRRVTVALYVSLSLAFLANLMRH